jgi:hypothetical protein
MTAEFSIKDIIKGVYNIDRISVREGRIYLFTDTSGDVNYEISEDISAGEDEFTLNLQGINLSEFKAEYRNLATNLVIKGLVNEGRLKTRISGDKIDFVAKGKTQISYFKLFNFVIATTLNTDIDVNLHSSDKGISFEKSLLRINDYDFGLSGFISSDDILDLSLTANNIDISGIKKFLPEKYLAKISEYNPSGLVNLDSKIIGSLSRTSNPQINISFNIGNGGIVYGSSAMKIRDLSVIGSFTNGRGRVPGTSSLSLAEIKFLLGTSQYSGTLMLSDFDSLQGDLHLKGKMIPSELKEFFNIKKISSSAGTVDFDLKLNGFLPEKEKYSFQDVLNLSPEAVLKFNALDIGLGNESLKISNVFGTMLITGAIKAENLKFVYKDHKITYNGIVNNLPEWIAGQPAILSVNGDVTFDELLPEKLFTRLPAVDSLTFRKKAFLFPDGLLMDLKFRIGSFTYSTFSAEHVTGLLSYKPKLLDIKTLNLSSQDGFVTGNGFIVQNPDKSFIGRGSFDFQKININKAFTSFKNFGQNFIKSENLGGLLSGSLSVLIPMDSLMNPVIKSITAEGKYLLENGALINFEPIKELSDFIELSELEDIKFEKLENDFFIRNNTLFLPQMDVKSSAADLAVNGKHDFDNNYEYHIKILLSQILSKKIRKPKPNTTEFGAIKDEGLGRTSVLLKIVNKGEDVKVTYDAKAAGSQIKNDIKTERQSLKTILNEEYGWFKNDTAVTKKPATSAPRFKITWEETDTVKTETEIPPAKNENPVKNLFKKK